MLPYDTFVVQVIRNFVDVAGKSCYRLVLGQELEF